MNPSPTIEAMREAAHALTVGDVREQLRAVQAAKDALEAATSSLLAELNASSAFEIDGTSTLNAWVRTQLHVDAGPASMLVRNAAVLRDLPLFADAAAAGRVNAHHLRALAFGLNHLGTDVMLELQEPLLVVAEAKEPHELFQILRELKDVKHPEALDDAHLRGMDKHDVQVSAVPDGWHLNGFLNTVTGAKLKKVLDSISAPHDAHDARPGSERRVQGLDDLLSAVLADGLPSDKGVKPHLSIFVDAETVAAAADQAAQTDEQPLRTSAPMPDVKPAHLAGFGPIGAHLLMYFLCVSDATAFLMSEGGHGKQAQILNSGRATYQPTLTQRRAVIARQHGICAAPGCHHTHLEIHHWIWWSERGTTDLDLLVGLCTRCHHLLHRGSLRLTGNAVDGFVFTTRHGRPVRGRRRRTSYTTAA